MADVTFQYTNECSLNIISTVYGASSVVFSIEDSEVVGIGATSIQPTCAIEDGTLYYNDKDDILPPSIDGSLSYKIVMYIEPVGNQLRLDFHRLDPFSSDEWQNVLNLDNKQDEKTNGGEDLNAIYFDALKNSKNIPTMVCIGEPSDDYPKDGETFTGILIFKINAQQPSQSDKQTDSVI